jgi:hypothetical protein
MEDNGKGQVGEVDASAGEAAFRALEGALRAMPAEEVTQPNSDVQESAIAALNLVKIAREPAIRARLALLPASLLAPDAIDQLERAAWAAWHAQTRVLAGEVQSGGARVDGELFRSSGQHLDRMLKLLDYHVGSVPEVEAELAGIRGGVGYQDRASDLVRAAAVWERWRGELEGDKRHFDPTDGDKARGFAQAIVTALRDSLGSDILAQADLRNRAWSLLKRLYDDVREAGQYMFRNEPAMADLFVPLRQVVHPRSRPKPAGVETAGTPPAPPPATASKN